MSFSTFGGFSPPGRSLCLCSMIGRAVHCNFVLSDVATGSKVEAILMRFHSMWLEVITTTIQYALQDY